jgi:LysM repeat protein
MSAGLAAGPPAPAPSGCGGSHVVVRGDTLYSIARRCRSSVVAIAQASLLVDPRRIEVGQRLVIPGQGAPAPAAEPRREQPAVADAGLTYRFAASDTLYSLARWSRVRVAALIAANPGINPHMIEIGDEIRLPAGAVRPEAMRLRERGPAPVQAVVRRNDQAPPGPGIAPAPVRVHEVHPHPAPSAPPRGRPAEEDQREPEGM